MQKIANFNCQVSPNKFIEENFQIEAINLQQQRSFNQEVLLWNSQHTFTNKHLQTFPNLKMLVNWGVEHTNIHCLEELKAKDILMKIMDYGNHDYLTHDNQQIKTDTLAFYLKKHYTNIPNSIYITRHGETMWNKIDIFQGRLDSPLTKKGITHARSMAEHLIDKHIDDVFTSPLGRCQQTAKIIADVIGARVTIVPEFAEMHFGIFQGKKSSQVKRHFAEFFTLRQENHYVKLFVPYPEGESYFDVYRRVIKPLMSILANYDNFVIVGHESLNRVLRGIIQELPLEKMIAPRQPHNEIVSINLFTGKEIIIQT